MWVSLARKGRGSVGRGRWAVSSEGGDAHGTIDRSSERLIGTKISLLLRRPLVRQSKREYGKNEGVAWDLAEEGREGEEVGGEKGGEGEANFVIGLT